MRGKRKLSDIKFIHKKLNKQLQKKPLHPDFVEGILEDLARQEKMPYRFLALRLLAIRGTPRFAYLVFASNKDRYVLCMDPTPPAYPKNTILLQLNEDFSITPISRPSERINIKELETELKTKQLPIAKEYNK